jgi:hypothetical protein
LLGASSPPTPAAALCHAKRISWSSEKKPRKARCRSNKRAWRVLSCNNTLHDTAHVLVTNLICILFDRRDVLAVTSPLLQHFCNENENYLQLLPITF